MKKERIFWGIFFIAAAVFLLVGKLGFFSGIGFWSLILTVFLGALLIKSVLHKSVSGILFCLAFLAIVYAKPLGLQAITPWPVLGAALLGSIGAAFFYHPKRSYIGWHSNNGTWEETTENIDTAQMQMNTSFAGSVKYVDSQNFQSADIHCSFGAMKVYFDKTQIPSGKACVTLDVSFGGVELYIPRDWRVINHVDTMLGGVDEKQAGVSEKGPDLLLTGTVKFSGVEIIYV